jgi:hypothetical protein
MVALGAGGGKVRKQRRTGYQKRGIKNGWFNWPFYFDPISLEQCEGWEEVGNEREMSYVIISVVGQRLRIVKTNSWPVAGIRGDINDYDAHHISWPFISQARFA